MSNKNSIAKTSGQGVLSPLPSSGGVRYRDMRHEDILQCSVIDIPGHVSLVSLHIPYHWVKGNHSNCAILYATLFFTYLVDGIKAMIRPGTPGSEGLHLLLPLMSAGLAGTRTCRTLREQYVSRPALASKNILVMMETTWSVAGRLTHHQYLRRDAHRCVIPQTSFHRRGSRQCIECPPTFTCVIHCDNKELYCTRGVPARDIAGCG